MRIGLLIYGSLDTLSGGYLYDRKLVEHLRAHGDEVEIVSLPWRSYRQHLADNGDRALVQKLANLDVDVLLQDELNHPSLFWLNRRLRQHVHYPLVSIVHHLRSSEGHRRPLNDLYRWVETRYLRSLDGFVSNSQTTRATVENLLSTEQPPANLVAFPAADHRQPPPAKDVIAQACQRCQAKGPLRILFVGNVIVRKGLHTLLLALAQLPPTLVRLDVVGSLDVDRATSRLVHSLIEREGLRQSVELHGRVSDEELRHHFMRSHLLVVPSYEGFGIVYLEAMSFGVPVIATTTGAAHEIVTHGENGLLIARDDVDALAQHIHALHTDRARLQAMSQSARQRYDAHPTWDASMASVRTWLHNTWTPHANSDHL